MVDELAVLNDALKNVKPPLEGIPSLEEPARRPLAEWMYHMEIYLRARGLDAVLVMDVDEDTLEPIPDFDWEGLNEIPQRQDDTVFLLLTSTLSYSTSQSVRGLRHAAPLWRRLEQARLSVYCNVVQNA